MVRIAVVEKEKCHPEKCGNYLCIAVCPVNRTGSDCIVKDPVSSKARVIEETCVGCNICVHKCPFHAIHIINLPQELDGECIFRYSENGFALYKLPIPLFGRIVGIVGRNGIGKSTAMKIISGIEKPNLGRVDATEKDVYDHFKGTEAQIFFDKIKNKEIVPSYKLQHVDAIAHEYSCTIRELLGKVCQEEQELLELAKELGISKVLDRNIKQISGGELQRVAIAAALLKRANLYLFDEPTSFLDIKQRMKMSQLLQKKISEDKAFMVIEHDLLILDAMTDLLHVMYGKPAAYGVSSLAKTARVGINEYLEGFLREENLRFRDKPLRFAIVEREEQLDTEELLSWNAFSFSAGDFSLQGEEGSINKHDVVGILGENGIGKTTFVEIIAGNKNTNITKSKLKISYKSQYLEKVDESVASFLHLALANHERELIEPLDLKQLLEKNVNELSGGELQRVYVAKCLAEEADLYLLDEPSAYLDVEQRIVVAKLIHEFMQKRGKAAFIVDHDLMFVDYVSTKLMVISGEPAVKGHITGPFIMEEGMNKFLTELNLSMRRDEESKRPRMNKLDSRKDKEQKSTGKLYY
ncbi:MAG: ribosome biogenesis/translation initiation ATPase RLI [Candidatus Woesearchaeota archaeon]|nr:MAG: ribosome biogenesis/translation initiation ATPase RLI [Candidatus Woesearchaeota archaeon]